MINYVFETSVTMKDYNKDKWWIDRDIVGPFHAAANNVEEALGEYVEYVNNDCHINISNNAIKDKGNLYVDRNNTVVQVGYVITGSADFQDDLGGWSKQYVDLWIEVITVIDTVFD